MNHLATVGDDHSKQLLKGLALIAFVLALGCAPRDQAVLERTKSARAKTQGGNVVKMEAGAVIDKPEQRSSECTKMDWKTIGIDNRFNASLVKRSMRAYITAGNFACYRIGQPDTEIMGSKDDVSKSRGQVQVSRIEIINKKDLSESHAALAGVSLEELKVFLEGAKPRRPDLVNIVYFEVKKLNLEGSAPEETVNYQLLEEVGGTFSGCSEIKGGSLNVSDVDYMYIRDNAKTVYLTQQKICQMVGGNLTITSRGKASLNVKIDYLEAGLINDLKIETLSRFMAEELVSREDAIRARELIQKDIDSRFGEGASNKEVFSYSISVTGAARR